MRRSSAVPTVLYPIAWDILRKNIFSNFRARTWPTFLLAWPSQDVFLLPHIPWIGKVVVYFLFFNLWSYFWPLFFVAVVGYNHNPIYNFPYQLRIHTFLWLVFPIFNLSCGLHSKQINSFPVSNALSNLSMITI